MFDGFGTAALLMALWKNSAFWGEPQLGESGKAAAASYDLTVTRADVELPPTFV